MPKVHRGFKDVQVEHDGNGNALIFQKEYLYGNYRLYISLTSEGSRRRLIGEVDTERKILMVSRDRSKHFHLKSLSYGFNRNVIEKVPLFRKVLLMEKDGSRTDYYLIPDMVILKQGHKLNFADQGFELQWFLPFSVIMEYKVDVKFKDGKLDMVEKINNEKSTING